MSHCDTCHGSTGAHLSGCPERQGPEVFECKACRGTGKCGICDENECRACNGTGEVTEDGKPIEDDQWDDGSPDPDDLDEDDPRLRGYRR